MRKNGFTLVEILSVIIIFAIIIVLVSTKGFGLFESSKNQLTLLNENVIKKAANELMTEVVNCDEDIDSGLINKYVPGRDCKALRDKATVTEGCLEITLEYLLENKYITGSGAEAFNTANQTYSIKGCLEANTEKITIGPIVSIEKTTIAATTTVVTPPTTVPTTTVSNKDDIKLCYNTDFKITNTSGVKITLPSSEETWNNGDYDTAYLNSLEKYFDGTAVLDDYKNIFNNFMDEFKFDLEFIVNGKVERFTNVNYNMGFNLIMSVSDGKVSTHSIPSYFFLEKMIAENDNIKEFLKNQYGVNDFSNLEKYMNGCSNNFVSMKFPLEIKDESAPILIVEDSSGNRTIAKEFVINSPTFYNWVCHPTTIEKYFIFDNTFPEEKFNLMNNWDMYEYEGNFAGIEMNLTNIEKAKYEGVDVSQYIKLSDGTNENKILIEINPGVQNHLDIQYQNEPSNFYINYSGNYMYSTKITDYSSPTEDRVPLIWDSGNKFLYFDDPKKDGLRNYKTIDSLISVKDKHGMSYYFHYVLDSNGYEYESFSLGSKVISNGTFQQIGSGKKTLTISATNCFGYTEYRTFDINVVDVTEYSSNRPSTTPTSYSGGPPVKGNYPPCANQTCVNPIIPGFDLS